MNLERVAVLGGGPGGLYAARLLKLSHPDAEVTVYEQSAPDKTFGFGVGLASRTQRNLREADSASLEAIVAAAHPHDMSMQVGEHIARLQNGDLLAIARTSLLEVLQQQARQAGVRLHFGERRDIADLDADLIIAADGINSGTRTQLADRFDPHIDTGTGLYLWCGTDFALPSAIFTPATTEHGTFVAHAYPYAPHHSTFLIETDEDTWRRAGFDVSTEKTAPLDSDETSLHYLQAAFADTLQHHPLIGNRTRWMRFRTITCGHWHSGNVVLLGDAAHTAHYSIGSGTKLAMEDAIALDHALTASPNVEEALAQYERTRRPAVEYLQRIAHRSELWWESFPQRMALPVEQLLIAYMTRAGKVSLNRFHDTAPALVRKGLASYADVPADAIPDTDITDWTIGQPLDHGDCRFEHRIAPPDLRDATTTTVLDIDFDSAWCPEATALVETAPTARTLWLTGPPTRSSLLSRLDFAERLGHHTDAVVVVEAPTSCRADVAAGLASVRMHLAFFRDPATSDADPALSGLRVST
ncbi:monooxygenase/aromatic ring hydroxylase [Rhodococcus opacus PD630]|uniref:FAD-dependent monooxygenase n=1 Tax=Rhodococcus opacus TaxID=37919 RepID=UPI00029CD124|nr:FAD-dependent monooxygenase [Rhodococcus opacus]AHK31794.1 putative tryptophan hydroxylase vioD [Rhodococcus opacus PD630]EHI45097.1 monooxygenase/aromatic ring hydroxylase [Rhodococcus opacus PD630]UDG94298.1 FAD-dependent monooxygenase [Rhodococcus opacus PD630]